MKENDILEFGEGQIICAPIERLKDSMHNAQSYWLKDCMYDKYYHLLGYRKPYNEFKGED